MWSYPSAILSSNPEKFGDRSPGTPQKAWIFKISGFMQLKFEFHAVFDFFTGVSVECINQTKCQIHTFCRHSATWKLTANNKVRMWWLIAAWWQLHARLIHNLLFLAIWTLQLQNYMDRHSQNSADLSHNCHEQVINLTTKYGPPSAKPTLIYRLRKFFVEIIFF